MLGLNSDFLHREAADDYRVVAQLVENVYESRDDVFLINADFERAQDTFAVVSVHCVNILMCSFSCGRASHQSLQAFLSLCFFMSP